MFVDLVIQVMRDLLPFYLGLLWIGLGVSGFVFWWGKTYQFDIEALMQSVFVGLLAGPTTWVIGWVIHGDYWVNRRK